MHFPLISAGYLQTEYNHEMNNVRALELVFDFLKFMSVYDNYETSSEPRN